MRCVYREYKLINWGAGGYNFGRLRESTRGVFPGEGMSKFSVSREGELSPHPLQ